MAASAEKTAGLKDDAAPPRGSGPDDDGPVPASASAPAPAPAPAPALALDGKSPGVARVEALAAAVTGGDRARILLAVFLAAYAYGLDGALRYAYQPVATAALGAHSLQATVNVVRSVVAAAAQPTAAKVADVFGRIELICLSVALYVLGSVVEAVARSVDAFAGGSVLYQLGYTVMILLVEVIIADLTSTRARLVFSYVPALPFVINAWVSGSVSDAVLAAASWRWGVGMWCIIYPLCVLPLVLSLWTVARRARREGRLAGYRSPFRRLGLARLAVELFWLLDLVGLVLVVAIFALILVPLTTAGGFQSQWRTARVVAPLVVGVACVPLFVLWELRAPHPLMPFALVKDRAVWAPLGIALFLNFAFAMQSDYLFTVLRVAFDFSVAAATRIVALYSFTSVVVGPLVGLVVFRVRRLKAFVVAGTALYLVAFGLLIHYRGSPSAGGRAGVIGSQVLLGIGGGMFPYTAQASLQVGLRHENLAVMTGIYLAMYNIGSALGNTVSGALWTQLLPARLSEALGGVNASLAAAAYADPFGSVVAVYPVGTPERDAVVDAYQSVQRILCITGACLCVPLVLFAAMLRNPRLTSQQTLAEGAGAAGDSEDHDDARP